MQPGNAVLRRARNRSLDDLLLAALCVAVLGVALVMLFGVW